MPLSGEYEPSRNERDRRQVEIYEATNGRKGGTLNGKPVIILTFRGAKSGKIRKTPLMRIKRDGTYAVVASNGGASTHPVWYHNIVSNPLVELQDGAIRARNAGPRSLRRGKKRMVEARRRRLAGFSRLPSPGRPRNSGTPPRSRPAAEKNFEVEILDLFSRDRCIFPLTLCSSPSWRDRALQ